jgi:hypothetical protein
MRLITWEIDVLGPVSRMNIYDLNHWPVLSTAPIAIADGYENCGKFIRVGVRKRDLTACSRQ